MQLEIIGGRYQLPAQDGSIYTVTLNPGLDRTLTVPEIRYDEVLRASDSRLDWGGKGFNVSRALQALGGKSVAMGLVGGAIGEMLTSGLSELGIDTDFVHISGETRTNTVVEEEETGRYIKVNESGPPVQRGALDLLRDQVINKAVPGSTWVFCGSLPPGVPRDIYAQLITLVQKRGGRACLDTSGDAMRLGCQAAPFLVKPNQVEAREVTGLTIETLDDSRLVLDWFFERGIKMVALSLGVEGVVLGTEAQVVHAEPPEIEVQTVVGVGDSLLGAIVWAMAKGYDLQTVARFGVAAGTAAATQPGVSVASHHEVEAMCERVTVKTLT